jgi:hypothetical protein
VASSSAQFGAATALALNGTLLVVGAPLDGGDSKGAIYIYTLNATTGDFELAQQFRGAIAGTYLGVTVAISRDASMIAAGAVGSVFGGLVANDTVYTYIRQPNGSFSGLQLLTRNGVPTASFGLVLHFIGTREAGLFPFVVGLPDARSLTIFAFDEPTRQFGTAEQGGDTFIGALSLSSGIYSMAESSTGLFAFGTDGVVTIFDAQATVPSEQITYVASSGILNLFDDVPIGLLSLRALAMKGTRVYTSFVGRAAVDVYHRGSGGYELLDSVRLPSVYTLTLDTMQPSLAARSVQAAVFYLSKQVTRATRRLR